LVLDDLYTATLQQVVNLWDEQMKNLKAFLLRFLNVNLKFNAKIQQGSEVTSWQSSKTNFVDFQDMKKQKKMDRIYFYNIELVEEVQYLLDVAIRDVATAHEKKDGNQPLKPKPFIYQGRGGDPDGINVL
jgi:hypothetical protein